MMKMKSMLFLLLLLNIISCTSKNQNDSHSGDYQRALMLFDTSFVNHFPKHQTAKSNLVVSEEKFVSHPRIWLKNFEVSEIDAIESAFKDMAIATYTSSDTCLLVIEHYLTQNNKDLYDRRKARSQQVTYDSCSTEKMPLPKFWRDEFYEVDSTLVGLSPNYTLYVLDAQMGEIVDANRLPNTRYFPPKWKHGYSKGVGINKQTKTVLYWFDVW